MGDKAMQQTVKITVIIAHRDPFLRAGLARLLGNLAEFEPVVPGLELGATVSHADSADVLVADYDSGLRLLELNCRWRDRVVIFTERDSEASICHAMEQGARGYLLLGCSLADVATAIRTVHKGGRAVAALVASRITERIGWEKLTRCELDILRLLLSGLRNKEIARATSRAPETVKSHVKAIFRKLDARSRMHAVMVARRRGILPEEVNDYMRPGENLHGGFEYDCGASVARQGGMHRPRAPQATDLDKRRARLSSRQNMRRELFVRG
jgi:DNA-binding NarL/FixJ family response regulator